MTRSLQTMIARGAACVALVVLAAAPARAGAIADIEIDSAQACTEYITIPGFGSVCVLGVVPGAGNFTITNDTTDWDVTGFTVTDDPVAAIVNTEPGLPPESLPAFDVSAMTTRTAWSAAGTNVGVDPTVACLYGFDGECFVPVSIYGAYEPQFSYSGITNYIGPGQSDGSFNWEESAYAILDPTYTIDLVNSDGVNDVCVGSLSSLSGSSSTCDPTPLLSTPEPASVLLLGSGLIGLGLLRCPKRRAA